MEIEKDTTFTVHHSRKGTFQGIATCTFDTEEETWWPIAVNQDTPVNNSNGEPRWYRGNEIPCRDCHSELTHLDQP